jgi:hypothetical protein
MKKLSLIGAMRKLGQDKIAEKKINRTVAG